MTLRIRLAAVAASLLLSVPCFAVEYGNPICTEPAQGFEIYLSAAMTKKHVPARFTENKAQLH